MDMHGQQHIPASRETVWQALNDPEILKVCIPGCQELTKSSDTDMTAVAVIKVGPVSARFQGAVTLSDLDPPNGYKISGEGQGGVAGFAKGTAVVRLEAVPDGTLLHYDVNAQIGGKLSQLGGRLIDATAKKMSGLFFEKFAAEILARQQPAATQDAAPASSAPATPAAPAAVANPATSTPVASIRPASAAAVQTTSRSGTTDFLKLTAAAVLGGAIVLAGLFYGGLLPGLLPAPDGIAATARAQISPDFASAVQLIMAAAIGYLFGARKGSGG